MKSRITKNLVRTTAAIVWTLAATGAVNAQDKAAEQTDMRLQQDALARGNRAENQGQSLEKVPSPKRIEDSLPLTNDATRQKSAQALQQTTVDLLALFNSYKDAHWNLNGPLYLPLHEFYQEQADMYRKYADVFAERQLSLGFSVDGRYQTIARTTKIPDMPAGYVTDNDSLKLLIDRVTVFQKEVYQYIRETSDSDPPTSNKFQDLAYDVDHNLWQLRIHLKQPGGLGENLPWAAQQGRDRAGNSAK